MSHANAALTPRGRLRLARLIVEQDWPVARAAERYEVSWRTADRWAERYRLLAGLQLGDRIVVHGAASTRLCYRVSERVEVLASKGLARYYDRVGPPQLAIVVCSGRRLGPGNWEKRTIWFARPAA